MDVDRLPSTPIGLELDEVIWEDFKGVILEVVLKEERRVSLVVDEVTRSFR